MTWTDEAREQFRDDGRRYPSDLTDAEWQMIEPVLRSYVMTIPRYGGSPAL